MMNSLRAQFISTGLLFIGMCLCSSTQTRSEGSSASTGSTSCYNQKAASAAKQALLLACKSAKKCSNQNTPKSEPAVASRLVPLAQFKLSESHRLVTNLVPSSRYQRINSGLSPPVHPT